MTTIIEFYNYVVDDLGDPRVKEWPLMSSPIPTILIIISYLTFSLSIGPRLMKNQKPYNLDNILILFNASQIAVCAYVVRMYVSTVLFKYSLICEPVDYSDDPEAVNMAWHVWLYFMIKIADLLDTVFFILRKKFNQVTVLHVYHHTGMIMLGWIGTKYIAGGHGAFLGFLNSIVHTIMYSYYLLTAWDKSYKTSLWWKKHITQIQLLQFAILLVYFGQILFQPNCGYPKWCAWVFLPQNIAMVILFSNFYYRTYIQPQQKEKLQQHQTDKQDKLLFNNNIHLKSH